MERAMNAGEGEVKAAKPKRPLEILRERRGGMSKELKEYFNVQQRVKKAIRAALAAGPRTVPQIARESGTAPSDVLWHLMAMRRYGEITDGPEQDGYVLYRLKGA
jgi:diadenosine tetraphosphate (Ap4A) HIT family hydrolase